MRWSSFVSLEVFFFKYDENVVTMCDVVPRDALLSSGGVQCPWGGRPGIRVGVHGACVLDAVLQPHRKNDRGIPKISKSNAGQS
jgi:hypothetical protein